MRSRMKIPAGAVTHRPGEPAPHLELRDLGRRAGIRDRSRRSHDDCALLPAGALIGAVTLFATRFTTMPAAAQALVDAELLKFSPAVVRRAAARDPRVAQAFLSELSERVLSFIDEIPNTFATVRQRVARHLLDLAAQRGPGREAVAEIVVPVSQQELADAVGTVREVVVRVLRELRQDGVVRTERDHIVILDPARLVPGRVELKFLTEAAPWVDTLSMTTLARPRQVRIEQRAVDELRKTLHGELTRPGDGTYDRQRRVWNGSIDRYPALILRCADVADVRSAIGFPGRMTFASRYAEERTAFLATPPVTMAWSSVCR